MKWNYEKAGVSISKGNEWVDVVKDILSDAPRDKNVVGGIGGFSGLYRLSENQLLAACCDGVGTKLEIAKLADKYRGLGQDLVGMNVNDLVTGGARPLFFLDYIACGKLNTQVLSEVVQGVVEACASCGCALLGGETAEMPGVYPEDGFDLAGFAVGLVDPSEVIDGTSINKGDIIVGLPSSGIHSNGFSLVRKVLFGQDSSLEINKTYHELGESLADALLKPTRLYVNQALKSKQQKGLVKGMAHITGGGLQENISRIIPEGLQARIDFSSWKRPPVFPFIACRGVEETEMRKVFNLGIGYTFIVAKEDQDSFMDLLTDMGEQPFIIGEVSTK